MADFEVAKDKVLMGAERRSLIMSEHERRTTAYHEAGHALVAKLLPNTDPVHKVSIIPRGMALGVTQQVPVDDRHSYSKKEVLNTLTICFGGRAAEEIVFDEITTGASNDIEKATSWARKMICEWGMSDKLGPITFGKKDEQVFLGRDFNQMPDYSEHTAVEIDAEVRRLVDECYGQAKSLLTTHLSALHNTATALLENEVLEGAEIDEILQQLSLIHI